MLNLNQAELELLNIYNCAANDLMCVRAKRKNTVEPCWLCLSDQARQAAREAFLAHLNANGVHVPTVAEAEKLMQEK